MGASGLFGVVLKPMSRTQLSVRFNSLRLFGIGAFWGGYESLVLPVDPPNRTETPLAFEGPLIRIHAGMERASDLIADMHQALQAAEEVTVGRVVRQEEGAMIG
ncbi:PLP-dependent transferase [Bradyrhizobium sp. CB3481]|nr:PLP-dependent transferase [Bradyrhizobium sp. CB3481]WFU14518.1 PLP-dependent transferase [Bradyrhizobium sp. CB3481]